MSETSEKIATNNVVIQTTLLADVEAQRTLTEADKSIENIIPEKQISYLSGWRLYFLTLGLFICTFVTNVEVSIVSTSLVTISTDFHSFRDDTWIVSAYQVTYTGFLVIWAKFSDILGRKRSLLAALVIFVAFSAGAGGAQSMNQLLAFRAIQGLGASGTFSVATVVFYEMIPKAKYPLYGGCVFMVVVLSTAIGPLIGGAVDVNSTWRWIFLIQLPLGITTIIIVAITMPKYYPYHDTSSSTSIQPRTDLYVSLRKIDFLGAVLLLAASFIMVTAFLEVSTVFAWSSPTIIILLVVSGLLWPTFFAWEWVVSWRASLAELEPLFPWRLVHNRTWMGMMITSLLLGIPFTVIAIEIPQRFQAVNGASAIGAGIRLLPFLVPQPIGSIMANTVAGATKIPPVFILIASSLLQILALGLMTLIPASGNTPHAEYVYEAIMGFGGGITFSILMLMAPHSVESKDLAVATSSIVQARLMGSAIGLALTTSVLNTYLTSHLSHILSSTQLQAVLQDISVIKTFSTSLEEAVINTFGRAYNLNIRVIIGFAVAQTLAIGFIWKKKQFSIHK